MKIKTALFFLGIFFFLGCSDERPTGVIKVKINNNSSNRLFIAMRPSSPEISSPYGAPSTIVEIQASNTLTWKFYGPTDDDYMWVFIYEEPTILNHSWEDIRDNGLYDQRLQLGITDGQLNITDEIDFDLNYPN